MNHPDEIYIDIGATSAAEVRAAGVDLLDPIALNRQLYSLGNEEASSVAVGDRFGCAALLEVLRNTDPKKLSGTLTVAFVAQQWLGARGIDRLFQEVHPDEAVLVSRIFTRRAADAGAPAATLPQKGMPGSGLILGVHDTTGELSGLPLDLKNLADAKRIKIAAEASAPLRATASSQIALPQRFAQLSIPLAWPATPAETLSRRDQNGLTELLEAYVGAANQGNDGGIVEIPHKSGNPTALQTLVETYGASGHEESVREAVQKLLPKWAKTETDAAGNLILHVGKSVPGKKAPRIAIVAHMDEIGYQVKSITEDGRLIVSVLGGGFTEYFLGHVVLVHTSKGDRAGVLELPSGADKPGSEWPRSSRSMDEPVRVDVGAKSPADVEQLGIKVGDWITIPKKYRPLLGHRANGRSFDDRVGCAALIEAVRMLTPDLPGRDVTFVWSTEEEVGLKGAAAYAAYEGRAPDYVFAVDTFVSSDSPLDGSAFTKFGSVHIPLAWPLRYSHSPGEVIDTRDLDALAGIIAVVARSW